MNMIHRFILCSLSALLLISCGNTSPKNGLTPLPSGFNDLADEKLFEAVTKFTQTQGAPPNTVYEHARIDLNGDGNREGIVLFTLPHTHWCGWDGCGMAIFQPRGDKFVLINLMTSVRGPIYVSKNGENGWRDIILRVTGTNMPDKNIVMSFNGNTYPNSPLLAPDLPVPLSSLTTTKLFF